MFRALSRGPSGHWSSISFWVKTRFAKCSQWGFNSPLGMLSLRSETAPSFLGSLAPKLLGQTKAAQRGGGQQSATCAWFGVGVKGLYVWCVGLLPLYQWRHRGPEVKWEWENEATESSTGFEGVQLSSRAARPTTGCWPGPNQFVSFCGCSPATSFVRDGSVFFGYAFDGIPGWVMLNVVVGEALHAAVSSDKSGDRRSYFPTIRRSSGDGAHSNEVTLTHASHGSSLELKWILSMTLWDQFKSITLAMKSVSSQRCRLTNAFTSGLHLLQNILFLLWLAPELSGKSSNIQGFMQDMGDLHPCLVHP